jgi:hypothetical protein
MTTAAPAAAATPEVGIGMPFSGRWAYNVETKLGCSNDEKIDATAHPSCHHVPGGGNWAVDLYAPEGEPVVLHLGNVDGRNVQLNKLSSSSGCGSSVKFGVVVDGVSVGWIHVAHLKTVSGTIANGKSLGTVATCYGVSHVHFEFRNTTNHSCYVNYSTATYTAGMKVDSGKTLGVLGSSNTGAPQVCGSTTASGSSTTTPEPTGTGLAIGSIDKIERAPGGIRITGWAIDPDTANAIQVHAYSGDGTAVSANPARATTANLYRPDVGAAYPGYGNYHGYSVVIPAKSEGVNTVCAYGINVGSGTSNRRFACASITVSANPFGSLDTIQRWPGGIRVAGWAIDPDTASAISVHAYSGDGAASGSNPAAVTTANLLRSDVGKVYPAYGNYHGYAVVVPAKAAGLQRVCAYGINNGGGHNPQIGCKSINVSPDPYGSLDRVERVSGGVWLHGWSIDPDTASPVSVHVYGGTGAAVGTNPAVATTANLTRTDVGAAYPGYGNEHGFKVFLAVGSHAQTFCAYGINNGGGHNPQLACKTG